jgi:hypothetical protein
MPVVREGTGNRGQGAGKNRQKQSNVLKINFFLLMRNKAFSLNDDS